MDEQLTARRKTGRDPAFPRLLGERLCLDFPNTIESPRDTPLDFLTSYADLARWGRHCDLLTSAQAEHLLAAGTRQPAAAEETLTTAIALRAAIQRTFEAIAAAASPDPRDLATIQSMHLTALSHAHLALCSERFAWEWDENEISDHLDRPLWPVAQSAVDLLVNGDLTRVKQCSGPDGCGWLFYDVSKNASRRWCSMEGCGSRAKMRRYNARRRLAHQEDGSESHGNDGRRGAGDPLSGRHL